MPVGYRRSSASQSNNTVCYESRGERAHLQPTIIIQQLCATSTVWVGEDVDGQGRGLLKDVSSCSSLGGQRVAISVFGGKARIPDGIV